MKRWICKNKKWLFSGIGTAIVIILLGLFISKDKGSFNIKENQNSGQQQIITNAKDNNISFDQKAVVDINHNQNSGNQIIMPNIKDSNVTVIQNQNTDLNEKAKAINIAEHKVRNIIKDGIFQEQAKGNITKEEASKLYDMLSGTLWEDLKSFLSNKDIKIDEHNLSLVGSGYF